MRGRLLTLVLFAAEMVSLSGQSITTIAGNGTAGFSGDGGPATQAMVNRVVGLATDSAGNVYLAEQNGNRIRKVSTAGVITTVAGTGTAGFSGDGGQAAQAQLNGPTGVCVAPSGTIYVNDLGNLRVRAISIAGIITTVAGSGSSGSSGDGGAATAAAMTIPIRCAVDKNGNLLIADQGAHRIRKVDGSGIISTYAGTGAQGFSGDGGAATAAQMNNPTWVMTDASGNLYVSDQFNQRVRVINSAGTISTVAGNGTAGFSGDGGAAASASLNFPGGLALDSTGALFISDTPNQRIRKVSGGTITTVAGNGTAGFSGDGGAPLQAQLNGAFPLTMDGSGKLYVGDTLNNRVRAITGVAGTGGAGSQNYYFSHLAFSGGYQTTITYVNYSPQAVTCTTNFYSDTGSPLPVPFSSGTVTTRTDVLQAGQSFHDPTVANLAPPFVVGWAQASCTGPVQASLLYRYFQSGAAVGEAGINAETVPTTAFVTFAQTSTGVAYANPSPTQSAVVTIAVYSAGGVKLGSTTINLGPLAHGAANLGPLLGLASFSGSVKVTSTSPILSFSLNFEAFPSFSSLPPGDLPSGTALVP